MPSIDFTSAEVRGLLSLWGDVNGPHDMRSIDAAIAKLRVSLAHDDQASFVGPNGKWICRPCGRTNEAVAARCAYCVPLDVALSFVTGRRVDALAHHDAFEALYAELSIGLDQTSPTGMLELTHRAADLFPAIRRETGRELDEPCVTRPHEPGYLCFDCLRVYIDVRVARYGAVLLRADVARVSEREVAR